MPQSTSAALTAGAPPSRDITFMDSTAPSHISILSIDDDPTDTEILRRFMKRIEGFDYSLDTCLDPEEGLAMLELKEFDVVMLDYEMGKITGLDMLSRVRKRQPQAAIIFLSGHGSEEVAVAALKAGASDYLPKGRVLPASLKRTLTNAVEKERLRFQVAQYQDDLEQTVRMLQTKNEEIQGAYHVLSHELKTPLTAIREFVSIVIDGLGGPISDDQKEYLYIAMRNCDKMRVLLNDILDVTRLETGKLAMVMDRYDPQLVIKHAVRVQQSEAASRRIQLVIENDAMPENLEGDEGRISQVLTNLLSNALKFTPEGGRITVHAGFDASREKYIVSVQDTGCGIPPDRISKVFDRLYQVRDEDFSIQGGLGLGLNIAQEIVRAHGGELWATSILEEGSCFSFSLPNTEVPRSLSA